MYNRKLDDDQDQSDDHRQFQLDPQLATAASAQQAASQDTLPPLPVAHHDYLYLTFTVSC